MFILYFVFAMASLSHGSDFWTKRQNKIIKTQWRCEIRRVEDVVSEYYCLLRCYGSILLKMYQSLNMYRTLYPYDGGGRFLRNVDTFL